MKPFKLWTTYIFNTDAAPKHGIPALALIISGEAHTYCSTHSLLIRTSPGTQYIAMHYGYIKYVQCAWFEQFGCLYFVYFAWAGFSGGEALEDKLYKCYCSHAIQQVMWYVHILLVCYSWVSREISQVIHMWV